MRKLRSLVAVTSVLAVMACQTAVASTSAVRDTQIVPVVAAQQSNSSGNAVTTAKADVASPSVAAESGGHKKLWITVGVIAAIVAVLVIAGAFNGEKAVY